MACVSLEATQPHEMADDPNLPVKDEDALQNRNAWFTSSPDPWREIAALDYEGDRTFASTVNRMVVSAEPAQHAAMEAKLLEALAEPALTEAGRLFVCRMLGLIGTAKCVPAVAPLLADERAAHAARMALDGIADASVDAAYRAALEQTAGVAKCGLIGSIARRGDVGAVSALAAIATNPAESAEVRAIAARAVEQLSTRV